MPTLNNPNRKLTIRDKDINIIPSARDSPTSPMEVLGEMAVVSARV
jgi:hypothetical protein